MHPQSFFLTKRSQAAAAAAAAAQAKNTFKRDIINEKEQVSSSVEESLKFLLVILTVILLQNDIILCWLLSLIKLSPVFQNWTSGIKSGNVNRCTTFCLSLLLSCRCSKMLNCVMIFHACDCSPPSCYIGLFSRHRVCEAPGPNFEPKIVKKAVKFSSPPQHSSHDCLIS